MSEVSEQNVARSLDAVRAQIFYLASDVEPVSAPAAALLRAVAESIEDGDNVAPAVSAPAKVNGVREVLSQMSEMRTLGSLARDVASASERRLGVVGTQFGYKR